MQAWDILLRRQSGYGISERGTSGGKGQNSSIPNHTITIKMLHWQAYKHPVALKVNRTACLHVSCVLGSASGQTAPDCHQTATDQTAPCVPSNHGIDSTTHHQIFSPIPLKLWKNCTNIATWMALHGSGLHPRLLLSPAIPDVYAPRFVSSRHITWVQVHAISYKVLHPLHTCR